MLLLKLFFSFFQIGLFSIGGGYAAMPLLQDQVVRLNAWLSMDEFADIITISEMTPGPIIINAATFVGIRVGGIAGAVTATLGAVAPSCFIMVLLAFLYYKYQKLAVIQGILGGLRPVVVALILSAGISILFLSWFGGADLPRMLGDVRWISVLLSVICFLILRISKCSPVFVILGAGAAGILLKLLGWIG